MNSVRLESFDESDTGIDTLIPVVAAKKLNEGWWVWECLPPRWVNCYQCGMNILPQPIMV